MCGVGSMIVSFYQNSKKIENFYFQAEDGIRYRNVTGVQTCALPIFQFLTYLILQWIFDQFHLITLSYRIFLFLKGFPYSLFLYHQEDLLLFLNLNQPFYLVVPLV